MGIGFLQISRAGRPLMRHVVQEGGSVRSALEGSGEFEFTLERAPLPSEFDVRKMDALDLARVLRERLEAEAEERRFDSSLGEE